MRDDKSNERISRLETAVEGFHGELGEIRDTLKGITATLSRSRETNWSVVFAGLMVSGSIYAAAIRPLEKGLERQTTDAAILAQAVVSAGDKREAMNTTMTRMISEQETLKGEVKNIQENGSHSMDKRISILEFLLKEVRDKHP